MSAPIQLGQFTLLRPLATGGMGQVWYALHSRGTQVAIKVLTPDGLQKQSWIDSINAEIRAVAGLNHPHIVRIHDAGTVGLIEATQSGGALPLGGPWFAMELADDGTLHDQPIHSFDDLKRLLDALLDALAHAHSHGVIHRDIKPANVLFAGGVAKLTDFGMVFNLDPTESGAQLGGGTPSYMAPEQFEGRPWELGPWTDLYSLGVLAFALATGRRPFRGTGWVRLFNEHLHTEVPKLKPKFTVPSGFEGWVRTLLAKPRYQRFQRAADAHYALERLTEEDTLPPVESAYATEETEHSKTNSRIAMPRHLLPPLPTYRAQRTRPPPLPVGLGLYGLRAMPFVGRKIERAQLWEQLSEVHRSRKSHAVVLRGPAGIGKSRLAQWLCQRTHEVGAAEVFRTTHSPLPSPLDGVTGLLARALRVVSDDPDVLRDALEDELSPRGLRDPAARNALAELLNPTVDGPLLSAKRRHRLTTRVISALSGQRPAVIWFDDVQWGPDTIKLCDYLLTAVHGPACLLVLTVREEALVDEADAQQALATLLDHHHTSELHLRPLSKGSSVALIQYGLGLAPSLAERLHKRIAGNPMFAVELVGDWVERGLLIPEDGGYQLANRAALRMPATVGAVWEGRLAQIFRTDPTFKAPLTVAAALGMEVDRGEWERACVAAKIDPPDAMWNHLHELRLVHWDSATSRMAFVHGLLRETILDRARRDGELAKIHIAVARSLQDPTRRGLHLLQTKHVRQGAALVLESARKLADTDIHRTIRLLQVRDEALEENDVDDPARVEGWLLAAKSCRLGSNPTNGLKWGRIAAHWAKVRQDTPLYVRALHECAASARFMGDLMHARHYIDAAMRLSDDLAGPLRAATLYECSACQTDGGDLVGAERSVRRALELFEAPIDRLRAGTLLGYLLAQQQQPTKSIAVLKALIPFAQKTNSAVRTADLHNALGEALRAAGKLEDAERCYQRALTTLDGTGIMDPAYRANLALVLLAQGRGAEAKAHLHKVMQQSEEIGAQLLVLAAHAGLAACAADQREWGTVSRHLDAIANEHGGLAADDIAQCLRYAGTHAVAMNQHSLGRTALELAALQFRTLGKHREADEAFEITRRQ